VRFPLLIIVALLAGAVAADGDPRRVQVVGDDAASVGAVKDGLSRHATITDELAYDALVKVAVSERGKQVTVTVTAYDFENVELARLVVRDRRARLAAALKRATWRKLGKAIGAAEGPVAVCMTEDPNCMGMGTGERVDPYWGVEPPPPPPEPLPGWLGGPMKPMPR
jgi:hypothetical protein